MSKRLDEKERIAAIIFDHDHDPPESRPTEGACHEIAEKIMAGKPPLKEAVFHEGNFYCPYCGRPLTQIGEFVYRGWTSWDCDGKLLRIHTSSDKMHWDASEQWGFDCLECDIHPIPAPPDMEVDYA